MASDPQSHIQNTICAQNKYLQMLKEDPSQGGKLSYGAYTTKPGQNHIDKDSVQPNLLPFGDVDTNKSKFFEENEFWIL